MGTDEPELIAHIIHGDHEQYRTLVDRHKQAVYRHCFYIVHDEDVAEDMAQEAFIRAYTHLRQYDPAKAQFKTWLLTIATRACLTQLRKTKSLPLDAEEMLSSDLNAEQRAKDREVHDAVRGLQPRYRLVVSLYYWRGYSYEEIATYMEVPVGSVRGWLHRAKKQLKEALS
jgi:RNA polymerase sigma-70 factor, ECF subfamily